MNGNGTEIKPDYTKMAGIEETDSCPCCKRQLKGLLEENEGKYIILAPNMPFWICLGCGVVFAPKSQLRKAKEALAKGPARIIQPQLVPPRMS